MSRYSFKSVIFDLDGVITRTAVIHARAWKVVFDNFLRSRQARYGEPFKAFSYENDYLPYVDGKSRYEGIQAFLMSRNIDIPFGTQDDQEDKTTICSLGNKKNLVFLEIVRAGGVDIFESTIKFINSLRRNNVKVAVASSSKNCKLILESAGIDQLFLSCVDGNVLEEFGLKGKPQPDIFVKAANNIGVEVSASVVVEDAFSGVQAGRNGGFGLVIGIARENNQEELLKGGADVVIGDMSEIDCDWIERWFNKKPQLLSDYFADPEGSIRQNSKVKNQPVLNTNYFEIAHDVFNKKIRPVLFLDFDGTLTDIKDKPELAVLAKDTRDLISKLSKKTIIVIISGRTRKDLERLIGVEDVFYAGNHGFDMKGRGLSMIKSTGYDFKGLYKLLAEELKDIKGVLIEDKELSIAVHYRMVDETKFPYIESVVNRIIRDNNMLRLMLGKKVFEIIPNIDWDKSKAMQWIIEKLQLSWSGDSRIVYMGDDITDEFVFRFNRTRGLNILVSEKSIVSASDFRVKNVNEARSVLEMLL